MIHGSGVELIVEQVGNIFYFFQYIYIVYYVVISCSYKDSNLNFLYPLLNLLPFESYLKGPVQFLKH